MLKFETQCSCTQSRDWDLGAYTKESSPEVNPGIFTPTQTAKNKNLFECTRGTLAAAMLHEPWSRHPQTVVLGATEAGVPFAHRSVCI